MSFPKVSPGDVWKPNAAKENALTDMLNAFGSMNPGSSMGFSGSQDVIFIINNSDSIIPRNNPVEILTTGAPETVQAPSHRFILAYGKPLENPHSFWGVAKEYIYPGKAGRVQISGVAALEVEEKDFEVRINPNSIVERKVRQSYIHPGRDGKFRLSTWGGAEVIWVNTRMPQVLARLGVRSNDYEGMFAVYENGDGTLTVKGGETDLLYGVNGTALSVVEDTVLPVEYNYAGQNGRTICLAAKWDGKRWNCQILSLKEWAQSLYIPGEQIYWELARYAGVRSDGTLLALQQVWTGGIINFRDRYYIG